MLNIIGIGLDTDSISVRGVSLAKKSDSVYLEKYTSTGVEEKELEKIVERKILPIFREDLEGEDPFILREAQTKCVSLLVVGTPLFATTHTELVLRGRELKIKVEVVHNGSIQSAMGCCGFNSYSFGPCVSIPFFLPNWRPYEFYRRIEKNRSGGWHTLCLLDIKINEPTIDTLLGKESKRYSRYMSIKEAIEQIEEAGEAAGEGSNKSSSWTGVGVERFGKRAERFTHGTLSELKTKSYGPPLHSLIIVADKGNEMEREFITRFFAGQP